MSEENSSLSYQVIKCFIDEKRKAHGIRGLRRSVMLEGSCIAQGEILNLLEALATAEDGWAEWFELQGLYANTLITEIIKKISYLITHHYLYNGENGTRDNYSETRSKLKILEKCTDKFSS